MMDATQRMDDEDEEFACNESDDEYTRVLYAKLKVVQIGADAPLEPLEFDVYGGDTLIGRDPEQCKIVIDNKTLSRVHAILDIDDISSMTIHDNHSLNKTFRNGTQLRPDVHYALEGGEIISLGEVKMKFEVVNKIENHQNGTDHARPEEANTTASNGSIEQQDEPDQNDTISASVPETPPPTRSKSSNDCIAETPNLSVASSADDDDADVSNDSLNDSSFIVPSQATVQTFRAAVTGKDGKFAKKNIFDMDTQQLAEEKKSTESIFQQETQALESSSKQVGKLSIFQQDTQALVPTKEGEKSDPPKEEADKDFYDQETQVLPSDDDDEENSMGEDRVEKVESNSSKDVDQSNEEEDLFATETQPYFEKSIEETAFEAAVTDPDTTCEAEVTGPETTCEAEVSNPDNSCEAEVSNLEASVSEDRAECQEAKGTNIESEADQSCLEEESKEEEEKEELNKTHESNDSFNLLSGIKDEDSNLSEPEESSSPIKNDHIDLSTKGPPSEVKVNSQPDGLSEMPTQLLDASNMNKEPPENQEANESIMDSSDMILTGQANDDIIIKEGKAIEVEPDKAEEVSDYEIVPSSQDESEIDSTNMVSVAMDLTSPACSNDLVKSLDVVNASKQTGPINKTENVVESSLSEEVLEEEKVVPRSESDVKGLEEGSINKKQLAVNGEAITPSDPPISSKIETDENSGDGKTLVTISDGNKSSVFNHDTESPNDSETLDLPLTQVILEEISSKSSHGTNHDRLSTNDEDDLSSEDESKLVIDEDQKVAKSSQNSLKSPKRKPKTKSPRQVKPGIKQATSIDEKLATSFDENECQHKPELTGVRRSGRQVKKLSRFLETYEAGPAISRSPRKKKDPRLSDNSCDPNQLQKINTSDNENKEEASSILNTSIPGELLITDGDQSKAEKIIDNSDVTSKLKRKSGKVRAKSPVKASQTELDSGPKNMSDSVSSTFLHADFEEQKAAEDLIDSNQTRPKKGRATTKGQKRGNNFIEEGESPRKSKKMDEKYQGLGEANGSTIKLKHDHEKVQTSPKKLALKSRKNDDKAKVSSPKSPSKNNKKEEEIQSSSNRKRTREDRGEINDQEISKGKIQKAKVSSKIECDKVENLSSNPTPAKGRGKRMMKDASPKKDTSKEQSKLKNKSPPKKATGGEDNKETPRKKSQNIGKSSARRSRDATNSAKIADTKPETGDSNIESNTKLTENQTATHSRGQIRRSTRGSGVVKDQDPKEDESAQESQKKTVKKRASRSLMKEVVKASVTPETSTIYEDSPISERDSRKKSTKEEMLSPNKVANKRSSRKRANEAEPSGKGSDSNLSENQAETSKSKRSKQETKSKPTAETLNSPTPRRSRRGAKPAAIQSEKPKKSTGEISQSPQASTSSPAKRKLTRKQKIESSSSFLSESEEENSRVPARSGRGRKNSTVSLDSSVSSVSSTSSAVRKKSKPRVMFTGYDSPQDEKVLTSLGGILTNKLEECSVLVTDRVRRTTKFLCMVGKGIPITNPSWIRLSKDTKSFLDPWLHIVNDREAEKKWGFNLQSSLRQSAKSPLLAGYKVFATKSVLPPAEDMKEMVKFAGGQWLSSMPRKPSEKTIVISCEKDKKLLVTPKKNGIQIYDKEILLKGLLKRELDFKSHLLHF